MQNRQEFFSVPFLILSKSQPRFHSVTDLLEKSKLFVLRNFVQVANKSMELMELDIEDFFQIVNDELLNVKDEQIVWECCIKWIDHDSDKRIVYLCRLLKAIRLGLLNKTVGNFSDIDQHFCVSFSISHSSILWNMSEIIIM